MVLKAGDVVVANAKVVYVKWLFILFILLCLIPAIILAQQDIPVDELDVDLSSYFDNFRVNVIYPSIKINKKISNTTSISGRYLTDIISSASMRCAFTVDGISSATTQKVGGARTTPNEWRHEFGAGIIQKIFDGKISLNTSYSIEHDYSSKTFAFNIGYPFAKKNTEIQFGFLGSFDKVFPVIRTWTKDRNTNSFDATLTQILSKTLIAQLDFSYITVKGYMLDGYQVVEIVQDNTLHTLEPIEPDTRIRRAFGLRSNISLTKTLTLQLGYRYYWDTWDVRSHTISTNISKNFNNNYMLSLEYRHYLQTQAYFFKPIYTQAEQYMTVDSYLNSGYSNQLSLNLTVNGSKHFFLPLLNNDNIQFNCMLGFYHRYTDSPDWFSRYLHLYAYLFNIGLRYFL